MLPKDLLSKREAVSLFGITFPRLTRMEALDCILSQVYGNQGIAVCFPDMSTLNLVYKDFALGNLIERAFLPLNDGIGLKIASQLQGKPFLENLNGTDFIPELFKQLKKGTSIFLVGSKEGVAEETRHLFQNLFPHLDFVGSSSGYLGDQEEEKLVSQLKTLKPDVVLVGMGNPMQLHWIDKQRQCAAFSHISWFAVGGLFDFYGGSRSRAPEWMRNCCLEWLYIVLHEPHKFLRYVAGIPLFLWRTVVK